MLESILETHSQKAWVDNATTITKTSRISTSQTDTTAREVPLNCQEAAAASMQLGETRIFPRSICSEKNYGQSDFVLPLYRASFQQRKSTEESRNTFHVQLSFYIETPIWVLVVTSNFIRRSIKTPSH